MATHYDTHATMAVPEPHKKQFLRSPERNLFSHWPSTFKHR